MLRISGTNLRGPDQARYVETSRLDIGQKMAGLAWFRMGTEFLGKKILSSRPIQSFIYGVSNLTEGHCSSVFLDGAKPTPKAARRLDHH